MGKLRDLLKKQEISFDNHHPNTPIEWDDNLHFHKKMTVKGPKGKKVKVSGSFHVNNNMGVYVTYDSGNTHKKIQDDKEREGLESKLKKEIGDIIENNDEEARQFIKHVTDALDSISAGQNLEEVIKRKIMAFDNVMGALGISHKRKIELFDKNKDLLSIYIEAPSQKESIYGLNYLLEHYSQKYDYIEIPGLSVYYITHDNNKGLTMGELTPYAYLNYKTKGFDLKPGV